jgi:hypothetical protein
MINLKKINQIREGISLRGRTASQYGNLPGPRYGMDDNSSENIPYTPKTEKEKRIKAALDNMGQQFKDHPKLKEAKDPREYDYEGDMAKSQLRSIISNAQEIHDMLEDNTNIAEWVQSKITLSADYITTVRDYMNSEVNEEAESVDEAGPFSYGFKSPRKGSVTYNAMMKRKDQDKNTKPIEPKDHMVGVAKVVT